MRWQSAPLEILGVLSESKVGRLPAALVETKKATGVSARADESHDPGLFFVSRLYGRFTEGLRIRLDRNVMVSQIVRRTLPTRG